MLLILTVEYTVCIQDGKCLKSRCALHLSSRRGEDTQEFLLIQLSIEEEEETFYKYFLNFESL